MPLPALTSLNRRQPCLWAAALISLATAAHPDPARIVGAEAQASDDGWRVSVTLEHADTGWEDYADGWRVELEDGTVLATRELLHPHVSEQPFTRSLGGVAIPDGVDTVHIRARTLTDGWADDRLDLALD